MKTNLTSHAHYDRQARLEYIIDTIGVGKVAVSSFEIDSQNRPVNYELTTTGVIIVKNKDNMVVTAFIAEMNQAIKIWRNVHGNKKMPTPLYTKIQQNEKVRKNQPC